MGEFLDLFSKKKNIIFCTSEYTTSKEFGGLAVFLEKFLNALKKDYKIHLIVASTNSKIKKKNGINIYNIKVDGIFLKILKKYFTSFFFIFQSWLINKKVNELVSTKSPEFIHFSNYQCLGLFYNNKLPIVTRLSSLESLWKEKKFLSLTKILEKITLKKSNLILCPSNFLIKELKKNYNLKGLYFPPLIEKLKKKKLKSNKKIILTFGSISPGKGSYFIEHLINEILAIDKNIYYYWIGNVDKQFYKSNDEFISKLRSKTSYYKRIKVLKNMNRKKLFKYLNLSEIILLPSLRDNSPNACLEALALEKIVIARKNSGFDDLIDNKSNGFLFNSKKNEFIKLLTNILNLTKFRKSKIIKNINKKNNSFSSQKVIKYYKNYINRII